MSRQDEFLSRESAAALLLVSSQTIYRWEKDGLLTPYKVGKNRVRYKKEDVVKLTTPVTSKTEC